MPVIARSKVLYKKIEVIAKKNLKANPLYLTNKNVKVPVICLILAEGQIFSFLPAPSRDLYDIEPGIC